MQEEYYDIPIRVLCVFSTLDRGGAESMCMNLFRNIDRKQVIFDFVKHTPDIGAFEREITDLGGRIYEAPRYQIVNHISYCNWWKRHFRNHPEHHLVHGHFFTISAVYFKVAKKYGRITIGHSHCAPQKQNTIKDYMTNMLTLRMDKYSDQRLACSELAGKWIYKKNFIVLKNAIDCTEYMFNSEIRNLVRRELNIEENYVLGTVGRIEYQKNPEGIISIFRVILSLKPNAKLLWVGDGPMRSEIKKRIQESEIKNRVIMTGVRSDVNRLLQAMDVFILPSFFEGLPVVAVEAQAAGLTCLLSDTISREVAITKNCRFLPINDVEAWAQCVLNVSGERKNMQQEIKTSGYDIHDTANWICEYYKSLLL